MSRQLACLAILVCILGWTAGCTTGKTQTGPDTPTVPGTPTEPAPSTLLRLEGRCDPESRQPLIDVSWPQQTVKGDIRVEMTIYPKGFERGLYSFCKVGSDTALRLGEDAGKNPAIREMGLLNPKIRPVAERSQTQASAQAYTESFLTLDGVSPGMNYHVRLLLDDKIIATEVIQAPICLQGKLKE